MPKFPVSFSRRKSTVTAEDFQDAQVAGPSFRVLERSEVVGAKSFDGGVRLNRVTQSFPQPYPQPRIQDMASVEDNMFAGLKTTPNRGSGSSNTTKTTSTDTSSRHSNVSTAPSSADLGSQQNHQHDEWRSSSIKKSYGDIPVPPIPKNNSSGFLKGAGRTFSFGQRKPVPAPLPKDESPPPPPPPPTVPTHAPSSDDYSGQRGRALTTSTSSTATPPKLDDQEFSLDLGGDFGTMFSGSGFDKRASVATLKSDGTPGPRTLTGNRTNGPSPLSIDRTSRVEPSPYSWTSERSQDSLLGGSSPSYSSPTFDRPPPVPRHGSPLASKSNRPSDIIEDEDAGLLKDSLAASKFLSNPNQSSSLQPGRYRRNEDTSFLSWKAAEERQASSSKFDPKADDDNLFDGSLTLLSRTAHRYVARPPSPPRNKVMTPAQFEKYRQDKERQGTLASSSKSPTESKGENDDDEDHYEDDDDDLEKSRQAAKQRRKQEAHMAVYRQQMMKVTGESTNQNFSRPSQPMSMSTPQLPSVAAPPGGSDGSDEDEEVPLAILAAHGFPSKNRPPVRISSMPSNPNLRSTMQVVPPQPARPGSSMGEAPPRPSSHLPAFAKNLPQDPFLGAGLVNAPARESLHFGGGSAAAGPQGPLPPGGLIGVIASEERSRAMRRGSPQIDINQNAMGGGANGFQGPAFDPVNGIPPQMMFNPAAMPMMPMMPNMGMLTPGDQAQIQMTQQMQQFMQMQMQFMQMMAAQQGQAMPRPNGHMATGSMVDLSSRHSFVGGADPMLEQPRLDARMRTMSMVQPSSASWIQPPGAGYAPSIHAQGGYGQGGYGQGGYAPSIAPSERSNIGLPGRYRPVSHVPPPHDSMRRASTMSGALGGWDEPAGGLSAGMAAPGAVAQNGRLGVSPVGSGVGASRSGSNSDDDDEEGWEAMKAKREKKRSLWKSKKGGIGSELRAMIS